MAKKLEEECGTKVLRNVPEVDQVDLSAFSEGKAKETRRFHESIPAYNRTPLVQLRGLGGKLGGKGIFVKNEAERFGMKAFKGLGGTYAMFRILCRELGLDPGKVDFSEFQKADVREKTAKYTFDGWKPRKGRFLGFRALWGTCLRLYAERHRKGS